jgi:protein-disulfide isomerase
MALPPKFAGQRLAFAPPAAPSSSSVPPTTHTLEVFLDYCCPFSGKMFRTLQDEVAPAIRDNGDWAPRITLIFRQQPQPWHPSSTLLHEAALAVLAISPDKFWSFSRSLFDHSSEYYDVNVVNETRNNTYRRLAALAKDAGVDEGKVYDMLAIPETAPASGSLNTGNKVTPDMKLIVKMHRLMSTHVTPTVIFDGVVQNAISSSWNLDQWKEWLGDNIK